MELSVANTVSKVLLFKYLLGSVEKLFSRVQNSLQTTFRKLILTKLDRFWISMQISNSKTSEDEEMSVLIDRLGIVCGLEGINGITCFGEGYFKSLFEEEEPSIDEIKETFGVFDVNKDGFIDASELQVVVCNLGFKEKCELKECKEMIKAFDSNGDGLVDFQEFVTFMDECLSP